MCVVATQEELEEARSDLREESVVGLDTETRPAFKKGESHLPCLVQAATARAVYLFQLRRTEVFPVLAELLADARIVKAGISLKDDLRALKQVFAFAEKNMLDLGLVARASGSGQTGVRNLAGILLGLPHPQRHQDLQLGRTALSAADHLRRHRRLGLPRAVPALPEPGPAARRTGRKPPAALET